MLAATSTGQARLHLARHLEPRLNQGFKFCKAGLVAVTKATHVIHGAKLNFNYTYQSSDVGHGQWQTEQVHVVQAPSTH